MQDQCAAAITNAPSGWSDSNRRSPAPKAGGLARLSHTRQYFKLPIGDCRLMAANSEQPIEIGNRQSAITLVRVERFELITKLILSQPPLPIGLHARNDWRLLIGDCRVVSAKVSLTSKLAFRLRWLSLAFLRRDTHSATGNRNNLAEGTGLEPANVKRGSFQDYCLTS